MKTAQQNPVGYIIHNNGLTVKQPPWDAIISSPTGAPSWQRSTGAPSCLSQRITIDIVIHRAQHAPSRGSPSHWSRGPRRGHPRVRQPRRVPDSGVPSAVIFGGCCRGGLGGFLGSLRHVFFETRTGAGARCSTNPGASQLLLALLLHLPSILPASIADNAGGNTIRPPDCRHRQCCPERIGSDRPGKNDRWSKRWSANEPEPALKLFVEPELQANGKRAQASCGNMHR